MERLYLIKLIWNRKKEKVKKKGSFGKAAVAPTELQLKHFNNLRNKDYAYLVALQMPPTPCQNSL
jgi:hypothetical protein